jgi:hypothetical protein
VIKKPHQAILMDFAKKHVKAASNLRAKLDAAYEAVIPLVLVEAHKKYPPEDMAVLTKYGMARTDHCLNQFESNSFIFNEDDPRVPLVPRYSDCSSRLYAWPDKTEKARARWQLAKEAVDQDVARKLNAYRELIASAKNFKEIVEVWPAAETLRSVIQPPQNLPSVSATTIEIIKSDNAGSEDAS